MKKIFYSSFILVVLLSSSAHSQELSLDVFINSILKNNPGVQKILLEKDIAAGSHEASLAIDDALLTSSYSLSHSEPNKILGFEPTTSDNRNLNLSYNRVFSNSGTRFSFGYSNLYTARSPTTVVGTKYYQPSFTVKLIQPLLRNAGGIQDSINIKLSQLNFKLSGLSSQENLENYITQLSSLYIDWYLASQELRISKEVHQQSIEQEKLTQIKVKRQVSESYELLRAQEIRADYFSRLQQASGRLIGLAHQIRAQMNLNTTSSDVLTPINPKNSKILSTTPILLRETNYLITTSRLKNILDNLEEQQLILLETKSNSKQSDLNLSFSYSRHGVDDTLNNAHSASLNKDDYSIMLEYKYQLGNSKANGEFHSQLAKKRQIKSDAQQRLIDAQATLANLTIQFIKLKSAIKSTGNKINLGNKKLKKETRLYKIGKLDLFELLRDQTSHMESRLNRERLYAQQLMLELKIGDLLDRNLKHYTFPSTIKSGE